MIQGLYIFTVSGLLYSTLHSDTHTQRVGVHFVTGQWDVINSARGALNVINGEETMDGRWQGGGNGEVE